SPVNGFPDLPWARRALSIFVRIRRAVEGSISARSAATEALYSIRAATLLPEPLLQLRRRDDGIVLVSQAVEGHLVIGVLGQVGLESFLDEIGLGTVGQPGKPVKRSCRAVGETDRSGFGFRHVVPHMHYTRCKYNRTRPSSSDWPIGMFANSTRRTGAGYALGSGLCYTL